MGMGCGLPLPFVLELDFLSEGDYQATIYTDAEDVERNPWIFGNVYPYLRNWLTPIIGTGI